MAELSSTTRSTRQSSAASCRLPSAVGSSIWSDCWHICHSTIPRKNAPNANKPVRLRGRSRHTHRRKPRSQNQHSKLAHSKSPPSNFDRVALSARVWAKKGVASRAGYDAVLPITACSIQIPCPNHKSRFACWSLKMTKPHDRPPLGHCGNTCTPSSKPPMAQQASR